MTQLPKKKPVQERAKATVDAILEGAVQVLASVGPLKTTTHRIATRAGVSVGTLYQYFPNKQAVFGELLRRYRLKSTERLMNNVMGLQGAPLEEAIEVAIDSFIAPFFEHPVMARALMQNRDAFVSQDERSAHMNKVQAFVAEAIRTRTDLADVADPHLMAFILVRTTEALSIAALIERPETIENGEFKRELVHLLVSYIRSARPPKPER